MPPFSETPEITKLVDFINKAAVKNSYPPFGKVTQGGVTDAGNNAKAGPVYDMTTRANPVTR